MSDECTPITKATMADLRTARSDGYAFGLGWMGRDNKGELGETSITYLHRKAEIYATGDYTFSSRRAQPTDKQRLVSENFMIGFIRGHADRWAVPETRVKSSQADAVALYRALLVLSAAVQLSATPNEALIKAQTQARRVLADALDDAPEVGT